MQQDLLKSMEMGAFVAFAFAAVISLFATQAIPPMQRPLLNAKILSLLFFLLVVLLSAFISKDLYIALLRYWGWIG